MIVLVCAGREFSDKMLLKRTLDQIHAETPIMKIVHGGYNGGDKLAGYWANATGGIKVDVYLAEWKTQGRSAGPKRNATMLARSKPDLVVAFPGGKGTADCVKKARALNISVIEVPSTGLPAERISELLKGSP